MQKVAPYRRRQLVYLAPELYVARIDPKLVVELGAEIREEMERGQLLSASLLQRILERVDTHSMEYTDCYDRFEPATYLLIDRHVTPLDRSAAANGPIAGNGRRPFPPRLLHVMPPPEPRPVEPYRIDSLATNRSWLEKLVAWWKGLSG